MKFSAKELNAISRAVQQERERRKYSRLVDFSRASWVPLEGNATYSHNWHIDLICDHLEALYQDEINNLLMNVPPGCMKSLLTSVIFPAWVWTMDPEKRFLTASYGQDLSTRDALKTRHLLESKWYKTLWGNKVIISRGQNQKTKYSNTAGGWRLATSVGGRGTGEHPDYKIIDDPHNVRESESDVERQTALDWYDQTLSSRGVSRGAKTLLIMQRLHENDLAGHIMEKEEFATEWDHLCLPMKFEDYRYTSTIGKDERTKEGELLWPHLFTEKKVKVLSANLGEYGTAGQLQQRPAPPGGGILKIKHIMMWPAHRELPAFELIIQSYDTAFKEEDKARTKTTNKQPDPSACTVYGVFTGKDGRKGIMLLDAWDERLAYPALRERVISDWGALYGGDDKQRRGRRADHLIVEDKASGQSLLQDLHQANIPAIPYNPGKAGKIERAHMTAPLFELDILYILESTKRPNQFISWAKNFVTQVEKFPNAKNDDLVDTFTQVLLFIKNNGIIEMPIYVDEDPEFEDYSSKKKTNPYS